jgi:peptidoglycan/LPS O-acetylase OafA/YrhL
MLLIVAAFAYGAPHNGPLAFAANLLMLQSLLQPFAQSFNQPSWSLSVEALCYVVFALAAHSGKAALLRLTAGAVALSALYLILLGRPEMADAIPRGFLGFFAGQALWWARGRLAAIGTPVLWIAVGAGTVIACHPALADFSPAIALSLLAWPAAVLLALRLRVLESRAMLWLGDRSYAIYLVNLPLIFAAGAVFGQDGGIAAQAGIVAAVLIASEASYRLLEAPARRAIRAAWDCRSSRAAIA